MKIECLSAYEVISKETLTAVSYTHLSLSRGMISQIFIAVVPFCMYLLIEWDCVR